ncbi:bifunctional RNase H/acid phosphatase [Amycolatopsis jiangsuensis]|uniref:Putative phosphoglycerate mutase n=1 Tax=Amycolatopsis jiangsuensis TaxID=1181879 RepID=A0A840IU40_9PSEU|nr:bifunctional RNase H/acid phosphatase [Amycolatopsis jiangsuensis]MBB4685986.1 putative phosphoglycerate mutase [Amycolatopsis jiangsuensis]
MTDRVVVEADGGSRGNPGPAGYGAVVKDAETGEVLAERHEYLGVVTNNVAEYSGLVAGLAAAADLGASTVDVRMDSKLVVEQMSGRWKIKHAALQSLAADAGEIAARFERVRYTWIPRAQNSHADRLANVAMDGGTGRAATGSAAAAKTGETTVTTAASGTAAAGTTAVAGTAAGSGGATVAGAAAASPVTAVDRVSPARWTGARGTPTKLFLLRHGQTEMSVDRRYSGRGDVPLTEHGQAQAAAAAKRLAGLPGLVGEDGAAPPIVASPLTRTMQTAHAVADAVGGRVETHPGLIETDFGEWEGLTFAEAAERDPAAHGGWLSDSSSAPPGGESFDAVYERVATVLHDLVEQYAGRTVVVVSHVTPIKTLLRMGLDAGPALLFRLHLDLASLSIVEFYPDGNASVRLVNDISHLS